tara:strand:+ start:3132 stop:6734 length:3603 start_codon:yes stop_codon:yes gene_type:complete
MEDFNQLFDDHLFNIDKTESKTIKLKEGERRMVSILFADIKGFTALSEKLDHEEVQSLMDQLMKIFSHSVDVHGGYVDKYTGDQIMALFGAKHASEVDTQRAINTGLDMLAKLKKFNNILSNSEKYKEFHIDFSIRVGINTGMVTTGAIGKEREGDYTVYGDTVNLASRMESNAPINSIMLPKNTMTLVENNFEFSDNGEISVKGKEKPISVFLVSSKKDVSVRHSSPFIGRENELNELNKVYNEALKNLQNNEFNKIHFISSVADAGIGKSRLVYEFLSNNSDIQNDDSFSIAHASNISSQPYYLFITLLKDILKISEVDSIKESKKKLEDFIKKVEKNTGNELSSIIPFIGFILGIRYEDDRLNDREEIQNHINISIRTLLESICLITNSKNKPYIFILEDLHWIDKMSMDLLIFITSTFDFKSKKEDKNTSYPLFICTFRKTYSLPDELIKEIDYTQLNLEALNKKHSIELISVLTKDLGINKNKEKELLEKSKGNPFFIEEWVSLINDPKTFTENLEESQGVKEYAIPSTINALILARIDALDKSLKSLLQKATIIGQDFFLQILSELEKKLGLSDNIKTPVDSLEKENFIQHFINQLDHYKFKHILTRDVAYSTILKSNKRILHKSVAEVIEENFQDKLEVFYPDLAIHYYTSENYDKAMNFFNLAANKAFFIFDYKQAADCYNEIISIIQKDKKYKKSIEKINQEDNSDKDNKIIKYYIKAKIGLSKILLNTGKWDESLAILNDINKSMKNADKKDIFDVAFSIGKIYSLKRNHDDAIKFYKEALRYATEQNDISKQGLTIGELAQIAFDLGKVESALKGFNQELDLFKKINEPLNISIGYGHLGMLYLQNGKMDKALDFFKKKYEISKQHDSKQQILMALGNISLIHNIRGEYEQSLNYFKEVLSISEDINDLKNQAMTYGNQGIIYKNTKEFNLALQNYNKQLEISQKIGDPWMESNAFDGIGLVYQKLSKFKESTENALKGIKIKESIKDKNGYASSNANLASTYIKMGELDKADKSLKESLKLFEELNNERAIHLTKIEISKALYFKNNLSDSIDFVNGTLEYFKKINDLPYLIENLVFISMMYRLNNQMDNSKDMINQAEEYNKNYNNNLLSDKINIEKSIIDLINNPKSLLLKNMIKNKLSEELNAYAHYNYGQLTKDQLYIKKSKELYKELYKKTNNYNYKYYLNQF